MFAVGWLVRIQRGERARSRRVSDERVCCNPLWCGHGGDWMEWRGMATKRKAECAWGNFRSGGRARGDHTRCRICESNVGIDYRIDCGGVLFLDGHKSEIPIR